MIECPQCGDTDVGFTDDLSFVKIPFEEAQTYERRTFTCNKCQCKGDFTGENDARIQHAIVTAKLQSINNILQYLKEKYSINQTYIERIFELPFGSLTKSENVNYAIAILRVLRFCPNFVEIADSNFDTSVFQICLKDRSDGNM